MAMMSSNILLHVAMMSANKPLFMAMMSIYILLSVAMMSANISVFYGLIILLSVAIVFANKLVCCHDICQ